MPPRGGLGRRRSDAAGRLELNEHCRRDRRVAAWIALIAAAAALATLLRLLLRDGVALAEAIGAVAVAGGGAWVALTRRGAARVAATVVVVAAAAFGAAALIERDALRELIALTVALSAFGVASRRALDRRERTLESARPTVGSRRRRDRFVLLMNPRSGGGKVERFQLVEEAKRRGIEPVLLEPSDDLVALAREAARTAEVLGMAGGDGSQALVAQVAVENELDFVCVPAGTRNHLALDLGLDRDAVIAALDAFASPVERRVDVAYVNERIFLNNVSLGIYAEIVRSAAYRDAKLQTIRDALPTLLGPGRTPFDLRFQGPQGGKHVSAQLILVSNNPYRLDQLGGIGSRPRLDSGLLGIVAVDIPNATSAAELAALGALGQLQRFSGWREWTAEQFLVESTQTVAAGIDGEAVTLDPPLRFRVAPAALRVRLPPTAAGLSPAALSPGFTRSALHELLRIAVGRN